jgi:hemerythrin-like domain-containing protein
MKTHGNHVHQDETGSARSQGKTELFDLLRKDHEELRDLFKKIAKSSNKDIDTRQVLFAQLERELLNHMEAEERFFYTALEQEEESRSRVLESYEEHLVARTVIGTFTSLAVDDERWPAKLKVLHRLFRQHADDEEHDLFKLAKKVLSNEQFQGIVAKVQELRRDPRHV